VQRKTSCAIAKSRLQPSISSHNGNCCYQYASGTVERILEATHGHLYYTQLVCNRLFACWSRQRSDEVAVSDAAQEIALSRRAVSGALQELVTRKVSRYPSPGLRN